MVYTTPAAGNWTLLVVAKNSRGSLAQLGTAVVDLPK